MYLKSEEYPIMDNTFEYMGDKYDATYAFKLDMKAIIQEAKTSHPVDFERLYDENTLRAESVRLYIDEKERPIYAMVIYTIKYKDNENRRFACGGYYPVVDLHIEPHFFQQSICW